MSKPVMCELTRVIMSQAKAHNRDFSSQKCVGVAVSTIFGLYQLECDLNYFFTESRVSIVCFFLSSLLK